jgi:hypothetical protein
VASNSHAKCDSRIYMSAALRAARRLLGRLLARVVGIDLIEVAPALGRRALVRHGLRRGDELQHPFGHDDIHPTDCVILLRKKRAARAKAALLGAIEHRRKNKSIDMTYFSEDRSMIAHVSTMQSSPPKNDYKTGLIIPSAESCRGTVLSIDQAGACWL